MCACPESSSQPEDKQFHTWLLSCLKGWHSTRYIDQIWNWAEKCSLPEGTQLGAEQERSLWAHCVVTHLRDALIEEPDLTIPNLPEELADLGLKNLPGVLAAYETRWNFAAGGGVTATKHPHVLRNYVVPPFFRVDRESRLITRRLWNTLKTVRRPAAQEEGQPEQQEQEEKRGTVLSLLERKRTFLFVSMVRRMLHQWPPGWEPGLGSCVQGNSHPWSMEPSPVPRLAEQPFASPNRAVRDVH